MSLQSDWRETWKQFCDIGSSTDIKKNASGELTLGSDGHLSQTDLILIHKDWTEIVRTLARAGLDQTHIVEFLHGLVNNWFIDSAIHVCSALMDVMPL